MATNVTKNAAEIAFYTPLMEVQANIAIGRLVGVITARRESMGKLATWIAAEGASTVTKTENLGNIVTECRACAYLDVM
jgi:hypothetical protein